MKLKLVLTTLCFGLLSFSYAQKDEKIIKQPTPIQTINASQTKIVDTIGVDNSKTRAPQMSSKSIDNALVSKKQSIIQELYAIEDERNNIEKDNSLSVSERSSRIDENNSKYQLKKIEFLDFVNTKGILNVSKQEQSYFLSILKSENNTIEYNKNIELIKQSN
jgi:hypothetical protein